MGKAISTRTAPASAPRRWARRRLVLGTGLVAAVLGAAVGGWQFWRHAGPGREAARLRAMERFVDAQRLLDQNRLVAAERELRHCLRVMPEHYKAVFALVDKILYPQGRTREAADLLCNAYAHVPQSLRVRWLMLLWTMNSDPLDPRAPERLLEDIDHMQKAVEVEPAFENRLGLAFNYVHRGEPQDLRRAFPQLERCLRERPESFEARRWMFECLMDLQQVDQAARLLENLPEAVGADPDVLRMRARVAMARDDLPAAVAAFGQLIEQRPADIQAHYQLGRFYKQLGREAQSQYHFERYEWSRDLLREAETLLEELKLEDDANSLNRAEQGYRCYRMGELTEAMGLPRHARGWFEACLDRRPGDRRAVDALQRLDRGA